MLQLTGSKNPHSAQRALAMILVLFLVVLAFVVAIAVLANASTSATSSMSVQTKNETFDAAETGLDAAVYQIDANKTIASGSRGSAPVDGYTYNWEVVQNSLTNLLPTFPNDVDPIYPAAITVQPHQAYLAGWASSITGGRTVYVEAIVIPGPPITFTKGAVVSGKTAQISHEQITDTTGKHSANVHGQTVTSSGGGQTPDGNSYATCNVLGCNAITGYDGNAYIDATPPTFLTAAQLAAVQSSALAQAQSGGSNVYVNGDWSSTGTWGTAGSNCVVYVNGNVSLSGTGTLKNYCPTTVVTGNWTMSGSVNYTIVPATTTHAIYVLGTGGATFNGTTNTAGFVYSANGPVTLNGGGTGTFSGALYSPFDITMNGGGASSFNYDPVQSTVTAPNPNVVPVAQWEY